MYKAPFSQEFTYALKEIQYLRPNLVNQADINEFEESDFLHIEEKMRVKHPSNIGMSRSIHVQAAILFYELSTQEGDPKRIRKNSVIALLLFLYQHGYWLTLGQQEFFQLIQWIEISPPEAMRETIMGLIKVIKAHLTKI